MTDTLPATFHPEVTNRAFVETAFEMGVAARDDRAAANPFLPDSPVYEAWALGHAMPELVTVFRSVAIARMDSRGYRVTFAACDRLWNDTAKADHIRLFGRPCPMRAFDVPASEAAAYRDGLMNGFVDEAGDLDSPVRVEKF